MEKAILIDGNSLIYRLYYASEAIKNKNPNFDVSRQTIKMLYSICFSLVWKKDFDYKIVAFDSKGELKRKQQLEAYKQNRRPMPLKLVDLLPKIKNIFENFGFGVLAQSGYEADDLIGSVADVLSKQAIACDIYTSDHDLLQLINNFSTVYLFKKGISVLQKYDLKSFEDEYGFKPNLIPDYKGLAGDASDNFLGISGIGPKTAKELLKQYESIENIYHHLDDIKPTWKNKLNEGKDSCYLCKDIATIDTSIFLNQDLSSLKNLPVYVDELKKNVYELNFNPFFKYFS